MEQYKPDKKKRYSAPTDYLRDQLIKTLYSVSQEIARYRSRSQTGLMRKIMEALHPVYNYFKTYAETNKIELSEHEKRVFNRADRYYSRHDIIILPHEAKTLLDTLTRLAYQSGLYNIHRLSSSDEEGI